MHNNLHPEQRALFNVALRHLGDVNRKLALQTDMYRCKDDINAICELLELDLLSNSVLDAFIEFLCTT